MGAIAVSCPSGCQHDGAGSQSFVCENPALWESDFDYTDFEWVDFSDTANSVISYLRKSHGEYLLCMHNFTPAYYPEYLVRLSNVTSITEIFCSDAEKYGGSGKTNRPAHIVINHHGRRESVNIQLAPLATMIFKVTL